MRQFLAAAQRAAGAAGALIRDGWRSPKTIAYKGAIDLVTSVDRAAERKIVELLQLDFPDHSILAEEETDRRGARDDYLWLIDPLDGTTNFAHGYPQFCVSIALQLAGETVLGVVHDPIRDEWFHAVRGQGAALNDRPIGVSAIDELDKALLATGFPYDHRENAGYYLSFFSAFMTRAQGIRRNGAAALDLCYVACGRLDGFWELKLKPWDTAAGVLIVEESGGRVSDFSGGRFSVRGDQTLVSNGLIHAEMVRLSSGVLQAQSSLTAP